MSKVLHAFEIEVEGAEEAWAVEGTPADSVMMALAGPLLKASGTQERQVFSFAAPPTAHMLKSSAAAAFSRAGAGKS